MSPNFFGGVWTAGEHLQADSEAINFVQKKKFCPF